MATVVVQKSRNPIVAAAFAGLRKAERAAKAGGKPEVAHPKDDAVRSEEYLRLVAALPCANCRRKGRSQAAHLPPDGKGIKQSDLDTMPLCTVGPDRHTPGCHELYDQYKLGDREWTVKTGKQWIKATRLTIAKTGKWPKKLAALAPKVAGSRPPSRGSGRSKSSAGSSSSSTTSPASKGTRPSRTSSRSRPAG